LRRRDAAYVADPHTCIETGRLQRCHAPAGSRFPQADRTVDAAAGDGVVDAHGDTRHTVGMPLHRPAYFTAANTAYAQRVLRSVGDEMRAILAEAQAKGTEVGEERGVDALAAQIEQLNLLYFSVNNGQVARLTRR